jgi:hypothetical protein
MSAEDLEKYETEMELQLYREYRDVVGLFTHVVETERRFYLTNSVELNVRAAENGEVYFEVTMQDAWVWDMYRPARFVKNVRVVTFKDVNVEELAKSDLQLPDDKDQGFSLSARSGLPPRLTAPRPANRRWPSPRLACSTPRRHSRRVIHNQRRSPVPVHRPPSRPPPPRPNRQRRTRRWFP